MTFFFKVSFFSANKVLPQTITKFGIIRFSSQGTTLLAHYNSPVVFWIFLIPSDKIDKYSYLRGERLRSLRNSPVLFWIFLIPPDKIDKYSYLRGECLRSLRNSEIYCGILKSIPKFE